MDRRDFFPLLSGALAALPLLAHAQTRRTPRIGVLWHAGSAGEEGVTSPDFVKVFATSAMSKGATFTSSIAFPTSFRNDSEA